MTSLDKMHSEINASMVHFSKIISSNETSNGNQSLWKTTEKGGNFKLCKETITNSFVQNVP